MDSCSTSKLVKFSNVAGKTRQPPAHFNTNIMKLFTTLVLSFLFATGIFAQTRKQYINSNGSLSGAQMLYSNDNQITASFNGSTFTIKKQGVIIWNSNEEGSILPGTRVNRLALKNETYCFIITIQWFGSRLQNFQPHLN